MQVIIFHCLISFGSENVAMNIFRYLYLSMCAFIFIYVYIIII